MPLFPPDHKTLIGMIHLGLLPGQEGSAGAESLIASALADLRALEAGGLDAVLIENWRDETPGPFVAEEAARALNDIAHAVVREAKVPVGINVLPNDYRVAFRLARELGLRFVQLDVLVDAVLTDYSYSPVPAFELRVDTDEVRALRPDGVALLATVQPKHYRMLEPKPLERSVEEAARLADAVVVTGTATGSAPDAERLRRARAVSPVPVIVGSGLDTANASELLAHANGAIVGTSLKSKDFERVEPERVAALVRATRSLRFRD